MSKYKKNQLTPSKNYPMTSLFKVIGGFESSINYVLKLLSTFLNHAH